MARRDINRLQGEIEELFADLWQVPRFAGLRHGFRPAVDCYVTEDPHQLNLLIELAGVEPASIEIVVDEQALMISGERAPPAHRRAGVPAGGDRVRALRAPDPARA